MSSTMKRTEGAVGFVLVTLCAGQFLMMLDRFGISSYET